MLLSDKDIIYLIEANKLIIEPLDKSNIGPNSIDVRLDHIIGKYKTKLIDLKDHSHELQMYDIKKSGYVIQPKEFILGATVEFIRIPTEYHGWIETKGNIARSGLQVHNCDAHIEPGFSGKITLEIINNNNIPVKIYSNMLIAQIFIYKMNSKSLKPYCGKYQNQKAPTAYKL